MEDTRHFKNLHLQENRLLRRFQREMKELKELQAERKKQEEEQQQARKVAKPKALVTANGFEFTIATECSQREETDSPSGNSVHGSTCPAKAQAA